MATTAERDVTALRVLIVDDDEDDFVVAQSLLSQIEGQQFEVEWAATYEDGLEAIGRGQHDVYLLDFHLGARTGLELLREIVSSGHKAPTILLTGQGDHDIDVEAMRAGALDYLVKGRIDSALLERSIRYAVERNRVERQLEEAIDDLEDALANIKTLRGLLPICSVCKSIRDDKGYWNRLESYVRDHSSAEFSHGVCPNCASQLYPDQYRAMFSAGEEKRADTRTSGHGTGVR